MIERLGDKSWEKTSWKSFEEIEDNIHEHGKRIKTNAYRYLLINFGGELEIYRRELQ